MARRSEEPKGGGFGVLQVAVGGDQGAADPPSPKATARQVVGGAGVQGGDALAVDLGSVVVADGRAGSSARSARKAGPGRKQDARGGWTSAVRDGVLATFLSTTLFDLHSAVYSLQKLLPVLNILLSVNNCNSDRCGTPCATIKRSNPS